MLRYCGTQRYPSGSVPEIATLAARAMEVTTDAFGTQGLEQYRDVADRAQTGRSLCPMQTNVSQC